jgi:hypothetical protein
MLLRGGDALQLGHGLRRQRQLRSGQVLFELGDVDDLIRGVAALGRA